MSGAIPTVRGLILIPLPIIWWNNQPLSPSSATWIVAAMTWCIENTSSLGLKLVLRFDGDIIFDTTMDDQQWRPPMWSKRTARADAMVNRVVRCWLVFGLVWLESYFWQVPRYRALQGGTGAWFKKFWWVQEIDWWSMAIEPPFFHTDSYVIRHPTTLFSNAWWLPLPRGDAFPLSTWWATTCFRGAALLEWWLHHLSATTASA
jgi:hypothetical protein